MEQLYGDLIDGIGITRIESNIHSLFFVPATKMLPWPDPSIHPGKSASALPLPSPLS